MSKKYDYFSARTGRFVTKKYADKHPDITVRRTIKPKPKKKK